MKILVIEDDEQISEVVCRGLRAADYVVEASLDGNDGLKHAISGRYELIVLDLMLPGLSGTEICRRLRLAGISVPVLMLTAKDSIADRVNGLNVGADDYLVKPFDFQELLARVRALGGC